MPTKRDSRQRCRNGQLGITLVEILAYAAVMLVVINLGATLFVSVLRMHDAGTTALEQAQVLRHFNAEFRRVVSESVALRPAAGAFETSEGVAVLELPPDPANGEARYAVFERIEHDDGFGLRRLVLQQTPEGLEAAYMKTYQIPFKALAFEFGDENAPARAVTVRFALSSEDNPQRAAPERIITTALGGIGGAP